MAVSLGNISETQDGLVPCPRGGRVQRVRRKKSASTEPSYLQVISTSVSGIQIALAEKYVCIGELNAFSCAQKLNDAV